MAKTDQCDCIALLFRDAPHSPRGKDAPPQPAPSAEGKAEGGEGAGEKGRATAAPA
eukprot:gene37208-45688_t